MPSLYLRMASVMYSMPVDSSGAGADMRMSLPGIGSLTSSRFTMPGLMQ